jgi:SAM-dependent methyltransferase
MRHPKGWALRGVLFTRRGGRAIRIHGPIGAARNGWRAFRASFRAIEVEAADHAFDLQAGTDTAGIVRLESLSIESPNRTLGVHYQASEPDSFRRTIAALPLRHEDFVFVDFGSGKGRALLLASEFPFKRIMGVEFSDELSAIARENVASFATEAQRCGDIEIVCEDAAEFELPADPLVLYFYNPFHEPVMREVMRRIVESLDDDPRPVFVILTRTTPLGSVVEDAGFARVTDLPDGVADEFYAAPVKVLAR